MVFAGEPSSQRKRLGAANQTRPASFVGCARVLSVRAGTLGYQWRFNGVDIAGANASTYTIPNVQTSNAGNYDEANRIVRGFYRDLEALRAREEDERRRFRVVGPTRRAHAAPPAPRPLTPRRPRVMSRA